MRISDWSSDVCSSDLILLANFPEPDRLNRLDGTVFTETSVSGDVVYGVPGGSNGTGLLVSSAVEQSNVDVAEQMTHLISAQQAYGLNSQVLTASNEMQIGRAHV